VRASAVRRQARGPEGGAGEVNSARRAGCGRKKEKGERERRKERGKKEKKERKGKKRKGEKEGGKGRKEKKKRRK
jgi:hypothetical protein